MRKKDKRKVFWAVILITLALVVYFNWSKILGAIPVLGNVVNNFGGGSSNNGLNPDQVNTETTRYNVMLTITPTNGCIGDQYTGTITSNMPNGVCGVWINSGTGWRFLFSFNLDANGRYSQATNINSMGTFSARAVCTDGQNNFRLSNVVTVTVRDCNQPNNDNFDDCDSSCSDWPDGWVTATSTSDCQNAIHTQCGGIGQAEYNSNGCCCLDCMASEPDDEEFYCDDICQDRNYDGGSGPVDSPGRCDQDEFYISYQDTGCCCYYSEESGGNDLQSFCQSAFSMDRYSSGLSASECSQLAYNTCNSEGKNYQWGYSSDYREYCCYKCVSRTCSDSDGGNDIYEQGTCTGSNGLRYEDTCYFNGVSEVLHEYYCDVNGNCQQTTVSCPGMQDACSSGACWLLD